MIEREITPHLLRLFGQFPIVTVTGPRQSGKTTLCRSAFADLAYANLEDPDSREFAESDPRRFLAQFPTGAVLDEIQRVPDLLSYLQVLVDEDRRNGQFVLTGSEQFGLTSTIGQSLAGRTALLRLLPFTLAERRLAGASGTVEEILYSGGYPRIHDQGLDPTQALADYLVTYVERDARRIGGIRDIASFRRFLRLCAGRVGQLVNLSSLGADVGVSQPTARQWLDVLEANDVVFRLPPYHTNIRKRLTKAPKLYFVDVGLASYLIGIRSVEQLITHPLRGPLVRERRHFRGGQALAQPRPSCGAVVLSHCRRTRVRPVVSDPRRFGRRRGQVGHHPHRRLVRRNAPHQAHDPRHRLNGHRLRRRPNPGAQRRHSSAPGRLLHPPRQS